MKKLVSPAPLAPKMIGILSIVFGAILSLCTTFIAGVYTDSMDKQESIEINLTVIEPGWSIHSFHSLKDHDAAGPVQQDPVDGWSFHEFRSLKDYLGYEQQALRDLARREQEAATESEKAQIQSERDAFLWGSLPSPASPGDLRDSRVVCHYAFDCGSGLVLNALMLTAGFGLVRLREWGRILGIWVAGLKIVRLLVLAASAVLVVSPVTIQAMHREAAEFGLHALNMDTPDLNEIILNNVGLLSCGWIFPTIALVVLTRPDTRAAYLPSWKGTDCKGAKSAKSRGKIDDLEFSDL